MGLRTEAAWWKRLLSGFGASVFALFLTIVGIVIGAHRIEPSYFHWSNGGASLLVAYTLVYGGLAILATYVFFVVPLVLLWPAESQRKHWYSMLCVAMLWPPLLFLITGHGHPSIFFHAIRRSPGPFVWLELLALCSCGCYLLLIDPLAVSSPRYQVKCRENPTVSRVPIFAAVSSSIRRAIALVRDLFCTIKRKQLLQSL